MGYVSFREGSCYTYFRGQLVMYLYWSAGFFSRFPQSWPPVVRSNRWPNKPGTLRNLNMGKVDPYKSKWTTLPKFNMEPENGTLE